MQKSRGNISFATLIFIILLSGFAFALDYRPATIKSMDVTITTEAQGSFSGTVSRGDKIELLALSLRSVPDQEVVALDEYMEIKGQKLRPTHVEKDGLYYANYKIDDLYEFADMPSFRIVRQARVKKTAKIGLGQDYSLAQGISGLEQFKAQTAYIEVNDQTLRSKAGIEFPSDSELETIRQVAQWVNSNIKYDFENYYSDVYSARHTYDARAGVCDEFANLSAAFLRIRGIPAKYISGISFDGERFGNHGWLEVYVPQVGWIGVDSTYGEAGYLDAGHFAIAATSDANEAVDFASTTTSRKPIEVSTTLGLPKVEINSVELFSGLTQASLKEKVIHSGESFEIEASVKNISGKDAIFPVELAVHKDFEVATPQQLAFFKKDEQKTLSWKVLAPKREVGQGYSKYGVAVLLPDGNVTNWMRMVPGTGLGGNAPHIEATDISPKISGEALEIQVGLENSGGASGKAGMELYFNGEKVGETSVELEALEKRTVTQKISGIRTGKVTLKIITDTEKTFEITVPEKISDEKLVATESSPRPSTEAHPNEPQTPQPALATGIDPLLIGGAAIAVVAVLGAIALLSHRK